MSAARPQLPSTLSPSTLSPPALSPLRIGLAGLGNVGAGVVRLLAGNADLIARRAGRPIIISAISARDRNRDRGLDLAPFAWVDDATELAGRDDVDVVVEAFDAPRGCASPALAQVSLYE